MRIWFDTEFYEDGKVIELISLGAVREDGKRFYAETQEAQERANKSDWLKENVLPHLRGEGFEYAPDDLREALLTFAGEKPEFWAYYGAYDWVVLCQVFGRMIDLPEGWPMFVRDVKQYAADLGNPRLPKQTGSEHDALADAIWTKGAFEFLQRLDRESLLEAL